LKLRETQALLYELITAREAVAATLAARPAAARSAVEAAIAGDARLPAVERLDVYAHMYFARIHEVLREQFPSTAGLVGARDFHALVTDYLLACRPNHPSLGEVGARLPAFIAEHPVGVERPFLAELARLERTRLALHDGPDARPLTREEVRRILAADPTALRLRFIPCHALLENRFAVAGLWRDGVVEDDGVAATAPAGPERLLVWRQGITVYHRSCPSEEARWMTRVDAAVEAGGDGLAFEALCEELGRTAASEEAAAADAFALLARWLDDELLAAD